MNNIIYFRHKEELNAKKQVEEFIEFAKGLTGFDKPNLPLDWNSWSWQPWMGTSLDFVKLGVFSRKKSFDASKDLLDPEIMDFAKAYVLQMQSVKTTQTIQEIVAVRSVEAALLELESSADITRINLNVYDRAAELIIANFSDKLAYRLGKKLEKLSVFIAEKGLSESSDKWVSSIKRPNDAHGHVRNKKNSEEKMPTPESLDALAEIWSAQPTDHRDIFVTSNCALLLSAPGRVGELKVLAAENALTYKKNSEGKSELFINWYGQKGFGFINKPVPEVWKNFTEESFRRIKDITEEPRKLAKWLEDNPDDFPLHENRPMVAQNLPLTPEQIHDALCISISGTASSSLRTWLKKTLKSLNKRPDYLKSKAILQEQLDNILEGKSDKKKKDVYTLTLRKLNTVLREYWLPTHFPFTDASKKMKYQHALNCFFQGQFNAGGGGFIKPFSLQMINNSLSIQKSAGKRAENLNIFKRWGYQGEAYSMTTKQFRHYLNTIAAKGKVGEIERARWSSRLDISQNNVYVHISDEKRVENARSIGLGSQSSSLATLTSKHQPILTKDVGVSGDRVAHYTEMGICVHDFALEPCTKFRDCLTCKKHKCIKGDTEKERRIRLLRDGLEKTLKQAAEGVEKGFYGADRWLAYSMDRLEKANALINILEDPKVEDGAVIICSDNGYSVLDKSLAAQGLMNTEDAPLIESAESKPKADLNKLMGLLGR